MRKNSYLDVSIVFGFKLNISSKPFWGVATAAGPGGGVGPPDSLRAESRLKKPGDLRISQAVEKFFFHRALLLLDLMLKDCPENYFESYPLPSPKNAPRWPAAPAGPDGPPFSRLHPG
ncbi:hypothetical protein EBT11_02195 [bacterium]|nr:hypothetical protein [bacterium]